MVDLSPAADDEIGLDTVLTGVATTDVKGIAANRGFRPGA